MPPDDGFAKHNPLSQLCTQLLRLRVARSKMSDVRIAEHFDRNCSPCVSRLLDGLEGPVLYSEHLVGDGQQMFEHAAMLKWEGSISKRANAPYRSDRNEGWLKIKTSQRAKFPVVGFVKDPTGVGALYLGRREGGDLVYVGGPVGPALFPAKSGGNSTISSPEVEADETDQEAEGYLSRAEIRRRSRVRRHHVRRPAAGKLVQGPLEKELTATWAAVISWAVGVRWRASLGRPSSLDRPARKLSQCARRWSIRTSVLRIRVCRERCASAPSCACMSDTLADR
jgi:hypothetical protein